MDPKLKVLLEELGAAIRESLSDSHRITDAITNIRSFGFDATIMLNATIAITRRDLERLAEISSSDGVVECKFNAEDLKYLKSLHINAKG